MQDPQQHHKRMVQVSKEMSRVLRHAPPPGAMDSQASLVHEYTSKPVSAEALELDVLCRLQSVWLGMLPLQGWVSVDVLAAHLRSKPSLEEIRRVVTDNDKQRFVLDEQPQPPRIRAAQGHSVTLSDPQLTHVTDAAAVPVAVHATSREAWQAIQDTGELRSMSRTHIHFATNQTLLRRNNWAQVLLLLKLEEAIAAGYPFFLSANGVLLTEGPLPIRFVRKVSAGELQQLWTARDIA